MASQQHMDRLSPVDASFLAGEREGSHMHVGAVLIFEGPPPAREELLEHIASRLPLVPRYRQRLAVPRLEMGRPLWVDDASFNLEYHARHTARTVARVREAAEGMGEVMWANLNPAPETPLNAPIGSHRRVWWSPRSSISSRRSRTRWAALSMTCCSPLSPARLDAGCAP